MKKLILFFLIIFISSVSIGDHYKYDKDSDGSSWYSPPDPWDGDNKSRSLNACGTNTTISMEANEQCAHPGQKKKSTLAGCPSGYQAKNKFKSLEIQMRFKGKGNFNRCLNQNSPDRNNYRDSWGVDYGSATYQCGDITVRGYLANPQELKVKSSLGFVEFDRRSSNYSSYGERRNFCKKDNCFEESSHIDEWIHWDTQTILEYKYISRNVFEKCREITF